MTRRILYVETYNGGSHARALELIRASSRHLIDTITLPPDHWRWRFIAAHHEVAAAIGAENTERPDALVLSGPLNVPALLQVLPDSWGRVPAAVFLHESQWTYPTQRHDTRPYVVGHLDALSVADQVWFNSMFHRDEFRSAALNSMSQRIRKLARDIVPARWDRTRVVYPPVRLDTTPPPGNGSIRKLTRILWVARWEREKRPDRFAAAIDSLGNAGLPFEVAILGAGPGLHSDHNYRRIADRVAISRAILDRAEYEQVLASCDVVISTTDHEFFGIAMLEAALAGVIPVLPNAHAYPETLPSAYFYPDGDVEALVRVLRGALDSGWSSHRPWTSDACRFLPENTVTAFDLACDELIDGTDHRSY